MPDSDRAAIRGVLMFDTDYRSYDDDRVTHDRRDEQLRVKSISSRGNYARGYAYLRWGSAYDEVTGRVKPESGLTTDCIRLVLAES